MAVNKFSRERDDEGLAVGSLPPPLMMRHAPEQVAVTRNRILMGLSPGDRARLLGVLQPVTFAVGDVVCESGVRMEHIFFPTSAVVSSLYTMEDGATVEMGLAGNDGVIGVSLFLGGDSTPHQDVVVVPGGALAMKAKTLQEEFARGGALQGLLLRYTQALITQISQAAVCNRLHAAEQRLCRWLLMCHDRVDTDDLQMTQEFISSMLGGRRETVTVAAKRLQDAGLIRYTRGHITILDRKGLEGTVCECYSTVGLPKDRVPTTQVLRRRVVKAALLG
jgi:CRP-like cAMP-binding protein